jgi:hypothetical protein
MAKFTLKDMERFATEAWGELGTKTVERWAEFNGRYFGGELKPVPLVITNTQPFGKRLAFCSYAGPDRHGRTITVNVPKEPGANGASYALLADNDTLLHEMVHQYLFERGEAAGHDSNGWRREIMRLNKLITGKEIWAGRSITKRVEGGDGKLSKVVRINKPRDDGMNSIGQKEIARWPHDAFGINLGRLGDETPSTMLRKEREVSGDGKFKVGTSVIMQPTPGMKVVPVCCKIVRFEENGARAVFETTGAWVT